MSFKLTVLSFGPEPGSVRPLCSVFAGVALTLISKLKTLK
jgi:hypothetical protein